MFKSSVAIFLSFSLVSSAYASDVLIDRDLFNGLYHRPSLLNYAAGEGFVKIMSNGDETLSSRFLSEIYPHIEKTIESQTHNNFKAFSSLYSPGKTGSDFYLCYVYYEYQPDVSSKVLSSFRPIPNDMAIFFTQSHEASHCTSMYDIQFDSQFEADIVSSVRETAADLGAVLDYLRVTGDIAIYHDFIRPLRHGDFEAHGHRTVWALDYILDKIEHSDLEFFSYSDVPFLIDIIIREFLLTENGLSIDINKEASKQLISEVASFRNITDLTSDSGSREAERLKRDISNTLSYHIEKYSRDTNTDRINALKEFYKSASLRYNLPQPEMMLNEKKEPALRNISNKSFIKYYID